MKEEEKISVTDVSDDISTRHDGAEPELQPAGMSESAEAESAVYDDSSESDKSSETSGEISESDAETSGPDVEAETAPASEVHTGLLDRWRELRQNTEEQPEGEMFMRDFASGDSEESGRLRESLLRLEGYINGSGLTPGQAGEAMTRLLDMASAIAAGSPDVADMEIVVKGSRYDADVAAARQEGVIEGRNARIVEEFRSADSRSGDTVPQLGGAPSPSPSPLGNSIFDIARQAL